MKSPQGPDIPRLLTVGAVTLMSLSLLLQFAPSFSFVAFIIGSSVGYFLLGGELERWMTNWGAGGKKGEDTEFSRRVSARLYDCREREENFRDEGERILKSIATLRDDLARNPDAAEEEIGRAEQLIKELEAEFSLRHAKASFFADCSVKLEELLARNQLVESIAARRRELREMRRTNFDDEAAVEETRFSIEQDGIELDTIVELSNSAIASDKTSQTKDLRERLERLRTSLGKPGKQESSAS